MVRSYQWYYPRQYPWPSVIPGIHKRFTRCHFPGVGDVGGVRGHGVAELDSERAEELIGQFVQ